LSREPINDNENWSQEASILFCGDVAMPSNRPDCAEAFDPYQSDRGVGANPNDAVSLAIETSEVPSGNRRIAANPPIVTFLPRTRRYFSNASPCAASCGEDEALALFVRFWLTPTPPLPDTAQPAAQAKGRVRYEGFVEALVPGIKAE
jgi:hypothetical protein